MLEEDPTLIIYNLLKDNWDKSNTPLADDPRFTTGWYNKASTDPQISITGMQETVAQGGQTGQTGGTGAGGVAQHRSGILFVNAWAGSYDDMEDAGPNGTKVSPKAASYQMGREVHRIIQEHATGTSKDDGSKQLHSMSASDMRSLIDDDVVPAIFRSETLVQFTYSSTTN